MTEIKAGYLTKCGGKVKNWKKRWIILRSNGFLNYYEKKGGNEKGSVDVINSGRLGYANSIDSADQLPSGTSADTAFAIVTKERTFTFYADSAAECNDWISCLTRVKSNDGEGGHYQGYPTPTNPNQPLELTPPQQQAGPLPPKGPLPPNDQPPPYAYPVGAYNGQAQQLITSQAQAQQLVGAPPMPQPQQPVGGPPMPQPVGGPPMPQPPPYRPAAAPPPAAPYPQPGYYQQPYRQPNPQPYQQPYRQPYQQPYQQPYRQPYQQPYYPTKQPYYYPQQPRPAYRPPPARQQQQSSNTTVVAGGMVISIGSNQQQGAGGQQCGSNVVIKR